MIVLQMNSSTADYLWVGGHYPVWAIGNDPPTGVEEELRPLLNKWEAHYFNGHQHDLEHIVEDHSKVNYVSTGAGKFCCYDDTHLDTVPRNSIKFAMSGSKGEAWMPMPFDDILSGFTSYRVGAESMQVYYHSHNGTVLYITPPILPRTKTPQPVPVVGDQICFVYTCRRLIDLSLLLCIYMPAIDRSLCCFVYTCRRLIDLSLLVYTCRRLIDLSLLAGRAYVREGARCVSAISLIFILLVCSIMSMLLHCSVQGFVFKMMIFVFKNDKFCIKNDEVFI